MSCIPYRFDWSFSTFLLQSRYIGRLYAEFYCRSVLFTNYCSSFTLGYSPSRFHQRNISHHPFFPCTILLVNCHMFFVLWRTSLANLIFIRQFVLIYTRFPTYTPVFYLDQTIKHGFATSILSRTDGLTQIELFFSATFLRLECPFTSPKSFETICCTFGTKDLWLKQ